MRNQLYFKDAEKQKQKLLNSPNEINLNKMSISNEIEAQINEKNLNGHKENSQDESDDDNPVMNVPPTQNETERSLNEQAAMAAAAAISGESDKQTNSNEPNSSDKRMFYVFYMKIFQSLIFYLSSTNG